MFFQKKETQKNENSLIAVSNGHAIALSDVPDEVFASGMLGQGFAIEPSDGTVYAPASGRVESIAETKHAYTILSDDGLDLLIHIGIDSVTLGGDGFLSMVSVGNRVKAGEVIARVDLNILHDRNIPSVTVVVIGNSEIMQIKKIRTGRAIGGEDAVLDYRLQKS